MRFLIWTKWANIFFYTAIYPLWQPICSPFSQPIVFPLSFYNHLLLVKIPPKFDTKLALRHWHWLVLAVGVLGDTLSISKRDQQFSILRSTTRSSNKTHSDAWWLCAAMLFSDEYRPWNSASQTCYNYSNCHVARVISLVSESPRLSINRLVTIFPILYG